MIPYYTDPWLTVYHGDARAVLAEMEPESVHCVVTSPPYWGLRDYGTASWIGGDEACDHKETVARHDGGRVRVDGFNGSARTDSDKGAMNFRHTCGKCGAVRQDSQLGLEPTPEEYVDNMVAVFREVRRVLRSDGTVWLNLGDSYASGGAGWRPGNPAKNGGNSNRDGVPVPPGLKPKDLVGIPWRVAFALQADGWYLRSDIVWSKPNPMPESVTDRPTKAHEYLFLLSKSPRYYYDADAVREAAIYEGVTVKASNPATAKNGQKGKYGATAAGFTQHDTVVSGRNLRSVWTIATAPYPGAHFATFPPKLVEPCIKAGTSEKGVCPECGAPWVREVERTPGNPGLGRTPRGGDVPGTASKRTTETGTYPHFNGASIREIGWRPSCGHGTVAEAITHTLRTVPATILDPFAGSGTTGMVAQSLSRRAVLIDLSMDYLGQLMERNRDMPLGLSS